jgi:hypothetical protein
MQRIPGAETAAFSETSIEEIQRVASSEIEQFDEETALIESFLQPFLLRERDAPVTDREMDSYG